MANSTTNNTNNPYRIQFNQNLLHQPNVDSKKKYEKYHNLAPDTKNDIVSSHPSKRVSIDYDAYQYQKTLLNEFAQGPQYIDRIDDPEESVVGQTSNIEEHPLVQSGKPLSETERVKSHLKSSVSELEKEIKAFRDKAIEERDALKKKWADRKPKTGNRFTKWFNSLSGVQKVLVGTFLTLVALGITAATGGLAGVGMLGALGIFGGASAAGALYARSRGQEGREKKELELKHFAELRDLKDDLKLAKAYLKKAQEGDMQVVNYYNKIIQLAKQEQV